MVLMALRLSRPEDPAEAHEAFRRALDWQMSFQCRDGGWAAFDKDVMKGWLEDMPFADHNAMLDPSCSDLTGRTLELLGYLGWDKRDRRVAARHHPPQEDPVRRWLVVRALGGQLHLRHVAGVARPEGHRLRHDRELGAPRPRLARVAARTRTAAGAKAATPTTTRLLKGKGPSTASQTAWALMGLVRVRRPGLAPACSAGCNISSTPRTPTVRGPRTRSPARGSRRCFYLKYDMYRNNFPLLALATYANARAGFSGRRSTCS